MIPLPLFYEVGSQWVTIPNLHTLSSIIICFYHGVAHEEVQGQLPGVVFLLPPLDPGTELGLQAPLLSCWSHSLAGPTLSFK